MSRLILDDIMDWAYSGVNKTVPRNAGPECANFMFPLWRKIETCLVIALGIGLFKWSLTRLSVVKTGAYVRRDRAGRRTLLVLMSLIWGMEIGYKFSSSTVIYLLNPCHVTTAIQVTERRRRDPIAVLRRRHFLLIILCL